MNKEVVIKVPETRVIPYTTRVPFHRSLTIIESNLTSNDEFVPETGAGRFESLTPVMGCGAWYRLVADGTHAPSFSGFKKSSASAEWVSTDGVLNILSFFYDGTDFWYSILQEA